MKKGMDARRVPSVTSRRLGRDTPHISIVGEGKKFSVCETCTSFQEVLLSLARKKRYESAIEKFKKLFRGHFEQNALPASRISTHSN